MIEIQKVFVDDHIAGIQHAADTLRAERERDRARAAERARAASETVRVRVGRWLVAVGEAIGGPGTASDDDSAIPHAA
jgi:hypothetical protein